MSNVTFLVLAYCVIWGGVFAYLFAANHQQQKLALRIRALEETLKNEARK